MSSEEAMEIIENLTEELGEKELKIMALEKRLKEEKIKHEKIMKFYEFKDGYTAGDGESIWYWHSRKDIFNCIPEDIREECFIYHFAGSIMTKEELIEKYDEPFKRRGTPPHDEGDWEVLLGNSVSVAIVDFGNGKYWVEVN